MGDLLPAELGLVISLFLYSSTTQALPHNSRDLGSPCTGEYAAWNVNGVSPGSIYAQLQARCSDSGNLAPMACKCNLAAYNLRMASGICQSETPQTWTAWAQNNKCDNSSTPSTKPPFDTSGIPIPEWATAELSTNGTFNVDAALDSSHGWSTIQVLTPILVGISVAAVAAILFFLYRRNKRNRSSPGARRNQKAWHSAHLHGPRRFFGLMSDRSQVQPKERKESAWEIDGNDGAQPVYPEHVEGRGSPTSFRTGLQGHQRAESHMTGHSRTESTTSLLTSGSKQSSKSFLSNIAGKFSALSLSKAYQSGTSKGPDYRRVHVQPGNADQRFKIDGIDTPAKNTHFTFPPAPEREGSLPSVLDIRRPTTAEGSHRRAYSREDSFPPPRRFTGDEVTDIMGGPASDFSLGTTDLITPVSPDLTENDIIGTRHTSAVNPASPLLPQNRFTSLPLREEHPSTLLHRNASTDTLAYQLYPRDPPAF